MSTMKFNGGKMEHLLQFTTDRYDEPYVFNPGADDVLKYGTVYEKIDGSNGLLKNVNREIQIFRRQDKREYLDNQPPSGMIDIPKGENPQRFHQHTYFYERLDMQKYEHSKKGKKGKQYKIDQQMVELVDRHTLYLYTCMPKNNDCVTVEWVGRKFQQTYGVDADVALCVHQDQQIVEPVPRTTISDLSEWMGQRQIEGLVFEYQGKYWKLRTAMFSKWKTMKIQKSPVYVLY